tara:strand:+ start:5901 stop:6374 length:474 start_codon:yes stop_codon:yes gene_type:complete
MPNQYVTQEIKVSHKAKLNMADLYSVLKKWFEKHDYSVNEKEYSDSGGGNFKVKWATSKEIDDYHKYNIDVTIKGKDCKVVEEKGDKLVEGKVEVTFEAYVEFDYDEKWGSPIRRFFRDSYDKWIMGDKTDEIKQGLVDETYDVVNKTRAFLRQHHF